MEDQNEKAYRDVAMRIGASLIVFFVLIFITSILHSVFSEFLPSALGARAGYVASELLYGALYFFSFSFPLLFFRLISRGREREPMRLSGRITLEAPLLILASVALIYLFAVINSLVTTPLISPEFDYDSLTAADYSEPYKGLLSLIVMALVPGICEELLFRGLILTNLLPYGKTGAVIASAFLFGLMHQNPLQMFYTTMAGIVLGLVYLYTDSIFLCMLVHVSNNAYSVALEWISEALGESGEILLYLIQGAFFLLAGGALLLLLLRRRRFTREADLDSGVFERVLPEREGYQRIPVDPVRKLRLFFAPTIIVFIVLTALEMGAITLWIMGGLS